MAGQGRKVSTHRQPFKAEIRAFGQKQPGQRLHPAACARAGAKTGGRQLSTAAEHGTAGAAAIGGSASQLPSRGVCWAAPEPHAAVIARSAPRSLPRAALPLGRGSRPGRRKSAGRHVAAAPGAQSEHSSLIGSGGIKDLTVLRPGTLMHACGGWRVAPRVTVQRVP